MTKKGENYTIADIGNFAEVGEYSYTHPLANLPIPGKVFLGEKLDMTSMEISVQVLKAGKEIPFNHKHNNHEEVYIVLKGEGEFIIDNEVTEVKEGSFVRIAPQAVRRWKNNSHDDLIVMVIQAMNGSMDKFTVFDGYEA